MDKSLSYTVDRQGGKTNFLAESIVSHLTDYRVPEGTTMLAFAPNYAQLKVLRDCVRKKLQPGEASIATADMIVANGKKILFRAANVEMRGGTKVDYIFMDNTDLMSDEFKLSIDPLRAYAIVIETTSTMTE